MRQLLISALTGLILTATSGLAEQVSRTHGGDTFIAGEAVSQTLATPGDVFVAGSVVSTMGKTDGDIHIAGYDLNVTTRTGGDLYAAGSTITIMAPVGEDITAAGFSLRSTADAVTAGNLRFFGRTMTIDGPIMGALTAFGGTVHLNAPVQGDAWIVAETVTYGPEARIDGRLILSMEEDSTVPDYVLPASRITREEWNRSDMYKEFDSSWESFEMPLLPVWMSLFSRFLISIIFLLLLAAIFLTFVPKKVDRLRKRVTNQPFQTFLLGVIGLSALLGMVPITALTIIGIPFIPFALLFIVVAWTLGYLLGAYAVARRVLVAFDGPANPSLVVNLATMAAAIVIVAVLNFVPFVGWVINYTLVLLGVGAMTAGALSVFISDPDPAFEDDMQTPATDP